MQLPECFEHVLSFRESVIYRIKDSKIYYEVFKDSKSGFLLRVYKSRFLEHSLSSIFLDEKNNKFKYYGISNKVAFEVLSDYYPKALKNMLYNLDIFSKPNMYGHSADMKYIRKFADL